MLRVSVDLVAWGVYDEGSILELEIVNAAPNQKGDTALYLVRYKLITLKDVRKGIVSTEHTKENPVVYLLHAACAAVINDLEETDVSDFDRCIQDG